MSSIHIAFTFAMLAGMADVGANLAATASQGFAKRSWGAVSILLVMLAFGLLGRAVQGIDLAIAYATLGTTGILAALCERMLFGQRLKPIAWLGLACILCAMMLLQSGPTLRRTYMSTSLRPSKMQDHVPHERPAFSSLVEPACEHDRAPLWENIQTFREQLRAPFYCPGHKGGRSLPIELTTNWASCDLNNLPDTDTLHCPSGSMRDAEQLLADAYGVKRSYMLVGGSSLGNMAAVMASVSPGDTVLVQRNAHKSVIAGIIHSGAIPQWIVPTWDIRFGISHGLSLDAVRQAIKKSPQAKALVALNPTYFGVVPDIKGIARLCQQHQLTLIADEAHGPHFRFGKDYPIAAENAGADIVVQSTHKILSGLSQAAVLHVCSDLVDQARVQATLQALQTTSPNFAILASIDLARRQMMQEGEQRLKALRQLADEARVELATIEGLRCMSSEHCLGPGSGFDSIDTTKLLINTRDCGWSGSDAQRYLNREFGVQPELSGASYILCIMTLGSTRQDIDRLIDSLKSLRNTAPVSFENIDQLHQFAGRVASGLPETVMTPREAFYRAHDEVPFEQALGCIAGEIITPYPPGIPVLMPGERFDRDTMELLAAVQRSHCPISAVDPTLRTVRVVK